MESLEASTPLTSAMEDYLEAIYHLEQERRIARVRDIARKLNVKMSSVTAALKTLGARGLIKYDPHQYITLTPRGMCEAKEIVRKHEVLKRFLIRVLQIEDSIAEDNACRIEHHLDPEVIDKLVRYVEFTETCPVDQTGWLNKSKETCDNCAPCLDQARRRMRDRAEAQKLAIKVKMTLAEAEVGTQVIIERITASPESQASLDEQGFQKGVIAEIEEKDPEKDLILVNVNGYHIKLNRSTAGSIFVKPM